MLLSIGMIVKNEEMYLDRCLAALKPILDNIDSELIIADTGSTDRTMEIARKYTDNVYRFEWINDFAAARNSTLDRAKGEWFMCIDADEILGSCDDIIKFFKSGEYMKYQTARYTQRNFTNAELSDYTDFLVPRLSRRKGVRFINPIHEVLTPFDLPTRMLTDIADHYGYIYTDEKTKQDKFRRNTELLEERLKNEADPPMLLYLQLYQSYNVCSDEKRDFYLSEGMKKCREKEDVVLVPFYGEKAAYLYYKKDWETLVKTADEYFALPSNYRPVPLGTDAEIHLFKGIALSNLARYEEAISEYRTGIKLLKDIITQDLLTTDMLLYCFAAAKPTNLTVFQNDLINCCMLVKDYHEANNTLQQIKLDERFNNTNEDKAKLKLEFTIMDGIDDYSRAELLYSQLGDYDRGLLQAFVRSSIERHKEPLRLIEFFKNIYKDEPMMTALLDVLYAHFSTGDCRKQVSRMVADGYGMYYELLYFMLAEGQDMHQLLTDSFDLNAAVEFCRNQFENMQQVVESYPADELNTREALLAAVRIYEAFMISAASDKNDIDIVFTAWGKTAARLCETEQIDGLPAQVIAAAIANNVNSARIRKNYKVCVAGLRLLFKTYPPAKPIIAAMNEKIQQEYAASNKPKQMTEMEALAQTVKDNIIILIESGHFQQAAQLLEEYSALMPDDPEIDVLQKQIAQ